MNNKAQAIERITEFLKSDEKGLLITGTHQYKKHRLIMSALNEYYKNANILFRINSLQNLTNDSFIGLKKQPKAGESIKIGNNYYQFDALFNQGTWYKTRGEFDFAIVYPIDALCRDGKTEPIADIIRFKHPKKLFLCSWTDSCEYDYGMLADFYSTHVVYDVEEEDAAYHQRVLDSINGRNN
ncbi:hypothetical protein FACS18949_07350 [Clostridia bacterium]|nr:hypothetical protein FACS189425_08960 [Clostridia bacterium]GHV33430.1 hypothetical protein FACS18949_07350 [Clostridia bacterium]